MPDGIRSVAFGAVRYAVIKRQKKLVSLELILIASFLGLVAQILHEALALLMLAQRLILLFKG